MSLKIDKSCSLNSMINQFYIFEVSLTDSINCKKIYRKIKKSNQGFIFSIDDKIKNNIIKIKISVFDFNNPHNLISINKNINNLNLFKNIIIKKNNTVIELSTISNYFICKYYFI